MDEPSLKNLTGDFGAPPDEHNELLRALGQPHVVSFNRMLDSGLTLAVRRLEPVSFELSGGDSVTLSIEAASIGVPLVPAGTVGAREQRVYPSECRQRGDTYKGRLTVRVGITVNGLPQPPVEKDLGNVPIMLQSSRCHLSEMSPAQLVAHGEHEDEWGGYFIIKGLERLVRMLLMTRRNYPVAVKRGGWRSRGALFSDCGVLIRCVRDDGTANNNVLHYLTDGTAKLMVAHRKVLFYIPLMLVLKCLTDCSDQLLYRKLVRGYEHDMHYCGRIQQMLRAVHEQNLHTQADCKRYVGRIFSVRFMEAATDGVSDDELVTERMLSQCVLSHLERPADKIELLVFMAQKLFALAEGGCRAEGVDALMMQELLLAGQLYQLVLQDRLRIWLLLARAHILKRSARPSAPSPAEQLHQLRAGLDTAMENFLATGNVASGSGLGLMQDRGLTIVAENINRMRFMSHFRAVHRGSFFQTMRTTEARQLLPDAWGFICPVHTPDGAPCGLLNHLSMACVVTDAPDPQLLERLPQVLTDLGMTPTHLDTLSAQSYTVLLDGRCVGTISEELTPRFVEQLRLKKIAGEQVPRTLEIVPVARTHLVGQYPGVFLFSGPSRMMRPVHHLRSGRIELVGTFEQVYLDVCVREEERIPGVTSHAELAKTSFLSNLAQLIPMPDCNQSPRNMYQCQMGKQTMGTPVHTWCTQAGTKMYRLQTPATPLFRPVHYDRIGLDAFPMGTNAIVAVISYTGYDMEDAMIINKASFERGFAHGCVYKSEFIELEHASSYFCRNPHVAALAERLDTDGLPFPGARLSPGEPLYCFYNGDEARYTVKQYTGKEVAYVDNVRQCGTFSAKNPRVVCVTLRIPRNPSVGDKFASRAGQKGICSQKWPAEDLPFTETGLVPDIVFNPHGFPSRMTIAMMVELMAGKSAALHGFVHDASPFRFGETDTAIEHFGRLLHAAGYNYYGTEPMYSGVDGRQMAADIFFGVVHYQRLRHMVSDKWQVRSTGPIDSLTRQPIKGRKRGGGIRFGEMERDALISHGASFLLQDRLFHCSDKCTFLICSSCGSLLGPITLVTRATDRKQCYETEQTCRLCGHGDAITEAQFPYIFKFFVAQLASVNINVRIDCKKIRA